MLMSSRKWNPGDGFYLRVSSYASDVCVGGRRSGGGWKGPIRAFLLFPPLSLLVPPPESIPGEHP